MNCKKLNEQAIPDAVLLTIYKEKYAALRGEVEQCLELLQNHNLDQAAPVVVDLLKGALEE